MVLLQGGAAVDDDGPLLTDGGEFVPTRGVPSPRLYPLDEMPTCPRCGYPFAPLPDPADPSGRTTEHPDCRPGGTPAARALPVAPRVPAPDHLVAEAAQLIRHAAERNRTNFTRAVWRIGMDRAGYPPEVQTRALATALRKGWITPLDTTQGLRQLEDYDRRETRWHSLIYTPTRRTRGAHPNAGRNRRP